MKNISYMERLARAWTLYFDLRDESPIEFSLLPKTHSYARKIIQARRRIDGLTRRAQVLAKRETS
jgi:hypothetical protein